MIGRYLPVQLPYPHNPTNKNSFCPCGGSLGVPRDGEGGFIQLEGPLCGEKEEKSLEFYPVVYFLDGMEGKK